MATLAVNKKARFDYEIQDTLEAGLVLTGQEVKSVRGGHAKLTGAFVTFSHNAASILNLHIPKYAYAGTVVDYIPDRTRPILLSKKQIQYLREKIEEAGLTIIPLSLYTKGRYIKVEIGIARGKKQYDKKESIKRRDVNRDIQRSLKSNYGDDRLR